jgi:hypothetical protein
MVYARRVQVCWSNTFSNVVKIDRSRPDCIQVVDSVVRENWDVDLSKGRSSFAAHPICGNRSYMQHVCSVGGYQRFLQLPWL